MPQIIVKIKDDHQVVLLLSWPGLWNHIYTTVSEKHSTPPYKLSNYVDSSDCSLIHLFRCWTSWTWTSMSDKVEVRQLTIFRKNLSQSFLCLTCRMREGTHGRHELPLFRHQPPRFAKQLEPPLCRPSLHFADHASTMQ